MNAPRIEWLQQRQAGIGGTDVSGVLGLSPYRSPLDVYLSKVEPVQEKEMGEPAYWGIVLEDVVAREFAKRQGVKVQRVNQMIAHPNEPWMLVNLDRAIVTPGSVVRVNKDGRLAGADGLLECKTASAYKAADWGRDGDEEEIPIAYAAQGMWYLAVTGLEWIDFACLVGGQKFVVKRMERDESTIKEITERCRAFWFDHVLKRVPPPATSPEDMQRLFPVDSGAYVDATPAALEDFNEARALAEQADAIEAKLDAAKARLKMTIGEASGLAIDGKPFITWKAPKASKKADWESAFKKLAPMYDLARAELGTPADEILQQHTSSVQGSRRFLFVKK
jgi:putative phage-type endonuclease